MVGSFKKDNFIQTKEKFDGFRDRYFGADNPLVFYNMVHVGRNYNKVYDYLGMIKKRFYLQYDWNELHQNKTEQGMSTTCDQNEFSKLNKIKTHLNLQLKFQN